MTHTTRKTPSLNLRYGIAYYSRCSHPTVDRYFRDGPLYPSNRKRIEGALRELGRPDLIRPDTRSGDAPVRPNEDDDATAADAA